MQPIPSLCTGPQTSSPQHACRWFWGRPQSGSSAIPQWRRQWGRGGWGGVESVFPQSTPLPPANTCLRQGLPTGVQIQI